MKISLKYLTLIILIVAEISCKSSDQSDSIKERLIGAWILDSVSNPSGKFYKPNNQSIFNLKNESNYSHDWQDGDVGGNETGLYSITINPHRALATISFIPDVKIVDKDTIRMKYLNFDIIKLSADRLYTVEQTQFIERKNLPSIIFNKHCIYKRSNHK